MSLNPQPMRTDLASALDSVEPARGDKHLSFEVIKKHIEDERPPIAFYSCSPIGLTYLHVYSARTISAMSQSGFKIVVNILDSPMFEHEAFLHLAKKWSSKSQETLVGKIVSDFRDLIKIVGGKLENIQLVTLSRLLKRTAMVEDPDILSLWHRRVSQVNLAELATILHPKDDLGKIVGQTLDVFFAAFLDKILPEFANEPALVLLAGEPRVSLYTKVLSLLSETECFSPKINPLYLYYLPQLPLFGRKGGPYLKLDDSFDTAYQYVAESWELAKRNQTDVQSRTPIAQHTYQELMFNMYRYVFKQELTNCLYLKGNELVETPIDSVIDELRSSDPSKFLDNDAKLMSEALTNNIIRYFRSVLHVTLLDEEKPRTLSLTTISDTMKIAKLLTNSRRLKILSLCNGSRTQKEISEVSGVPETIVSIYLKEFDGNLVKNRKEYPKPCAVYKDIKVTPESFALEGFSRMHQKRGKKSGKN